MKLLKKWFKKLQTNMGYTLIEVAAVVAVTATLGAIVVPIAVDKTNQGKVVAARESTKSIGDAITGFVKDTGNFPAASSGAGSGTTHFAVLRSGAEIGALGATHDPIPTGLWTGITAVDVLDNHLTINNPGGTPNTLTPNDAYLLVHKFSNWKGPYSEPFANFDPWGHNYLVYVKAMHTATSDTGGDKQYGWILSAGPDGKLNTNITNSVIQGDDLGYALYSAESTH